MKLRMALVLALVAFPACTGATEVGTGSTASEAGVSTTVAGGGTQAAGEETPAASVSTTTQPAPDLVVYIAAIEDAAVGTSYEGTPETDPEVFLAVGELFCELLNDGGTVESVLAEYLDAFAEEGEPIDPDDSYMAGVVMGVALEVLCPWNLPDGLPVSSTGG